MLIHMAEQAKAKKRKLIQDTAIEYLRLELGKGHRQSQNLLNECLACEKTFGRCAQICSYNPVNLAQTLARNSIERHSTEDQLRKRTSLTALQREAALTHLYGPANPSSSSSSSTQPGPRLSQKYRLNLKVMGALMGGLLYLDGRTPGRPWEPFGSKNDRFSG